MVDVPRERFEELVSEALDSIPAELGRVLSNCVVLVEDDVPPGTPSLLGLYVGTPLTERGEWYSGVLPDRITIYRLPILGMCRDEPDVVDQVRLSGSPSASDAR